VEGFFRLALEVEMDGSIERDFSESCKSTVLHYLEISLKGLYTDQFVANINPHVLSPVECTYPNIEVCFVHVVLGPER